MVRIDDTTSFVVVGMVVVVGTGFDTCNAVHGYMLNAYMYVQVLQYRADTVSADSSFGDSGYALLVVVVVP